MAKRIPYTNVTILLVENAKETKDIIILTRKFERIEVSFALYYDYIYISLANIF